MVLTLKELKKIASNKGVPQATIEKDYALSIALNVIAESKLANNLIFKGGTAIKKIYFEETRYSEDLDFNVNDTTKQEILKEFDKLLSNKEIDGVTFQKIEHEETSAGLKANLKFIGPLNYAQRIRFDFNYRDNTIKKPIKTEIINSYKIGAHSIFVISLEEILAEKIHALSTRTAPRDLYNFRFLTKNKVQKDNELIRQKFAYYDEKPDKNKILENIQNMETKWKDDLGRFMMKLPEFKDVKKEVFSFI